MALLTASALVTLALQCAPAVHPQTMAAIVKTESGLNPWAIGVVDQVLPRQPQSLEEALEVVKGLVEKKANFSVGLAQINRYNFDISKPELAFDPCNNLRMAASNLEACYERVEIKGEPKQATLLKAVSCYYSGNPARGFKWESSFGGTSHVQRLVANADNYKIPALGNGGGTQSEPVAPVAAQLQPSFESWDVLRQYPRYEPTNKTTVNGPSALEIEAEHQENIDEAQ